MSGKKIVFLDLETTDIGDIDFTAIESFGEVAYFPTTSPEQLHSHIGDAQIVITNKVEIDAAAMDAASNLEVIQIAATGVNNVDLDAAKQKGLKVYNVAGYSTPSVTQHVFGLVLNLATHVNRYAAAPERWAESPMFTRLDYPIFELAGKRFGIVGYGEIGRAVATVAESFGMEVVALGRPGASDASVTRLDSDAFFSSCDVISLHCPLTDDNFQFINKTTLELMKPSALLINTGRGDLVHEEDLVEALKNGSIGGAGIDVISAEPPAHDHPLIATRLPNLLVTPHTASSSAEARQRLVDGVATNFSEIASGDENNSNRVV